MRGRGRDFFSLSHSFILSSYVCKCAQDEVRKEWELREREGVAARGMWMLDKKKRKRRKKERGERSHTSLYDGISFHHDIYA